MKIVAFFFILTVASAFMSGDSQSNPIRVKDLQRQIDSFNTETKINQELFRIKINKISKS